MGAIYDTMIQFFKEDDWPFTPLEGKPIIRTAFSGKSGQWSCFAQAREDQQRFLFYSISAVNAPEDKRMAMAEFLTRANYGLIIGNFELDFSDGEIRYKTSIDVEGDRLTTALIKQLVYANVFTFDRYLPGVMAVIYGNVSPVDAINQVEGQQQPSS